MTDFSEMDAYLEAHLDASIAELSRLVAQPSVGAQNWGLAECAQLVAQMLEQRGFAVEIAVDPLDHLEGQVVLADQRGGAGDDLLSGQRARGQ